MIDAAAKAGAPERSAAAFDGVSLLPTLLGKTQPERPFLYREFSGYLGYQVVRIGDWKGVRVGLSKKQKDPAAGSRGGSEIELYNLRKDPAEATNVAAEHPDTVEKMKRIMRDQHTPSQEFPFAALDAGL